MTKFRLTFWTLGLVAILLIAACAPASTPAPAAAPPVADVPTNVPASATAAILPSPVATEPPTQQSAPAVATSRGDALEATDPTTVRLDSGQLQLVEFFRFT